MIKRLAVSLIALAVVVGLAIGLALLTPARRPAPAVVELPHSSRVVCTAAGRVLLGEPEGLTVQRAAGGEAEATNEREFTTTEPFILRAESLLAAGVLVEQPQRAYVPCASAVTSGMVLVPDPATTELTLVNADSNEASVDLTLLGPDGEIVTLGARGIALAPGETRRVALSVLAPTGPVGVAYRASAGRVALMANAVEGRPTRFVPPTAAAESHLIPGVPGGATSTRLMLSNPHESRVDVSVEALGATASYEPATATDLSVPAMSSVIVDLGEALAGEPTALRVTTSEAIGAAVVTAVGAGSPATLVSAVESERLALNAPGGGELAVTNAGGLTAEIVVSANNSEGASLSERVTVAPGTTATLALPEAASPLAVDVMSDVPVLAAASSATDAGTVVVQGVRSTLAELEGIPAHLDPGLR